MKNTSPPRFAARIPAATGVVVGAALLAIWPVLVALARHDGSPVGADTPVYVWWARLVGAAGASAVGMRPGVPDAVAVVSAALGIPTTVTVSALGCALVAMVGLAGCAVLRAGGVGGRTPAIGLVLAGLFSTYLASGHLSNACFAALFVLALAFVLDGELAGMTSAVALVGAAGLSHPDFLLVATPILVVAAALAMAVHARRDAVALGVTAAGGVVVTGLGLLAASTGGRALDVPTSLDVFLAQTHQTARLQALFLERFRPKVASYAMWAWIPLAALATRRLRTPLGRLLIAWVAVTVVGVAAGLLWQPYPPHRIVAFAF